ncbi:5-formyltetrahydrofolate cyclo-ligase [Corynebacterium suedekumii]|uniref:5-formyltetrahydrofolate cyclo-ligase n=1 Tax=Corynebacterium suedekumii TaxID=3049801 RepID=A0ABY8VJN9_9CORY|nr:5-formyltetrahydrofolate cyclo-ligase [Corynebacterium suedekumii]WIM69201.1 5-formyltetrahydrofolate cyclo-ligase [Corynebacterium suedekumii]
MPGCAHPAASVSVHDGGHGPSRDQGTEGGAARADDPGAPGHEPGGHLAGGFRDHRARRRPAALTVPGGDLGGRLLPLPGEPGGTLLLDALHGEASSLLLPVSLPGGHLDWARYQGRLNLNPGALGIAEPTGDRLGPDAIASCRLILVPALGVSPDGIRLGKGGGYYDRALAHLAAGENPPRTAVLLYNGEIRDDIPAEGHDMPVDLAITPAGVRHFR